MNKGSIVQSGTPEQSIPVPPASLWRVYRQLQPAWRRAGQVAVRPPVSGQAGAATGSITLLPAGATSSEASLPGIVRQRQLLGNVIRYQVECEAGLLTVDCLNRSARDLLAGGRRRDPGGGPDQLCEVA